MLSFLIKKIQSRDPSNFPQAPIQLFILETGDIYEKKR